MENLQEIKEALNKSGFSAESLIVINQIIDQAIADGFISIEEKDRLLGIVDAEIELANIEEEVKEDVSFALESYTNELDQIDKHLAEKTDKVKDNFVKDINNLKND